MKVLCATTNEVSINEHYSNTQICSQTNIFLVLVCVEIGDETSDIKKIANKIESHWKPFNGIYKDILLVPFGHLSEMSQPDLRIVANKIDKLFRVLQNKGASIFKIPPNESKYLFAKFLLFDTGESVRFSSSGSGLEQILKDVLSIYGAKQVLSKIANLLTYNNLKGGV